ncbi:MAG: hypothetical protein HY695_35905 [Deltaproteobacteria bacterium]|nr:hypothetical protein [Deltaproteobacteria bacterium]
MTHRNKFHGKFLTVSLFVVLSLSGLTPSSVAAAEVAETTGSFHIIWRDAESDGNDDRPRKYVLIENDGQATELVLDDKQLRPFGGPVALNRKEITVRWEDEKVSAYVGQSARGGRKAA